MLDPSVSPRNYCNINNLRNQLAFPPPFQYRKQNPRKILVKQFVRNLWLYHQHIYSYDLQVFLPYKKSDFIVQHSLIQR